MSDTIQTFRSFGNADDLPFIHPDETDREALYPGARAHCAHCADQGQGDVLLIAKCGEINRWHWAHEGDRICAGEGEGAWHLAWKAWATLQGADTEIDEGPHRADIAWPDGAVYECQTNYTDAQTIRKREDHYGDRLTWVYRWTSGRFGRLRNVGDGWFAWSKPAMSMAMHERPVLWHHLDRLYEITTSITPAGELHVRFARGERDRYGEVLYGSKPAPFHVAEAADALKWFTAQQTKSAA